MSPNRVLPELGILEIVEVYEFYDEPVLFSVRNSRDQFFLACLARDSLEQRQWLYAPMSINRFREVRSGGLDLYNAFRNVEDGYVFNVTISKLANQLVTAHWERVANLQDDLLPEPNDRLNLETTTLPTVAAFDAARVAIQAHREVLALQLKFEGITRTEAPAGLLGQLLDSLQQVVYAVGQSVQGRGTTRAPIPAEITKHMRLSVTEVYAGSFGIVLHAEEQADMFSSSAIGVALDSVFQLLQATTSDEALLANLAVLRGRSASKYREFLLRVAESVQTIDIKRGSPRLPQEVLVRLSAADAERAASWIGRLEPTQPTEYDISAKLIGINVRTKSYELWDTAENRKYSGRIDDSTMDTAEHATVNEVYIVTIREETTKTSVGEIETKYRLMRLTGVGSL